MKVHLAIGQFEFVEEEVENAEQAALVRSQVREAFEGSEGIPMKDFVALLYEYATTGSVVNGGDVYGDMSEQQKVLTHCMKKLVKKEQEKMGDSFINTK